MPVRSPRSFVPSAVLAATAMLAALPLLSAAAAQSATGDRLLISAQELSRQLNDRDLVLLQVGPREDYDAGHVPGARFIDMDDLAAPRAMGQPSLELPDPNDLRARLERLGISDQSRIVVIPGEDWGSPATRIVFTLQVAGFGARTQLLNGGTRGWKAAGLPISKDAPPAARPGHLTIAQDRSLVVDFDWLRGALPPSGFTLVDARAPVFYEGPGMNDGRGMKHDAGHIPGAHNLPFNTLFNDDVTMMSREELRSRFDAAGIKPGEPLIVYCHIGQQATMVLFAARILGHPVRLYDGSFTDWEARKGPIENAKAPAP